MLPAAIDCAGECGQVQILVRNMTPDDYDAAQIARQINQQLFAVTTSSKNFVSAHFSMTITIRIK